MTMAQDYYEILGVAKGASQDEIKAAFRKKAHQYHPDKQGGDEQKFKEVNAAYQVLGNPDKRKQYDQFGPAFEQMGGGGPGGGFDFSGFQQGAGVNFDFGDLGDIFGQAFGFGGGPGGRGGQRERRGRHIEMDVLLTFEEAAFGVEKELSLYKAASCDECDGSGAEKGTKMRTCPECGGKGQVTTVQRTMLGNFQSVRTCGRCRGEGKEPEKRCGACNGEGIRNKQEKIGVQLPAGISDGEVLRVSGKGEAVKGGRPGDLYVQVRVKKHKDFARQGFDVHSVADVEFPLAALGGTVSVATLDGDVDLKIPSGTQPGTVLRLKGKGVPHLKRSGRGDHLVTVNVVVPKKLSRRQRKFLEEEWGE